jgi:small subunit ribosomal protein S20
MVKKVRKAVDNGDKDAAKAVYVSAQSRIDAIADKKIIHKNTAARHKGKLSSAIKAMG